LGRLAAQHHDLSPVERLVMSSFSLGLAIGAGPKACPAVLPGSEAEAKQCGYNPALIGEATSTTSFFQDSRDLFLHGLCGERRMGTCSSMPVLYV
jgi:hypothetical protein